MAINLNKVTDLARTAIALPETGVELRLLSSPHNIIVEGFVEGDGTFLFKYPREPQFGDLIRKEGENLANLQTLGIAGASKAGISVPKLLGSGEVFGRPYILCQHMPGDTNDERFNTPDVVNSMVDWLTLMAKKTQRDGTIDHAYLENLVDAAVQQSETPKDLAAAISQLDWSCLIGAPFVYTHGDLSYQNIVIDGDQVAVVDWAIGEEFGLPGFDVIDYLLYGFYRQRQNYLESIDLLLFQRDGRGARQALLKHCTALDFDPESIGHLVAASLLKRIQILAGFPTGKAAKKTTELYSALQAHDWKELRFSS